MSDYKEFHRVGRFQDFDIGTSYEINDQNCYRLPKSFDSTDTIVDVGANIGYFTDACLRRGAGKVIAVEAHPENFNRAAENLKDYGSKVDLRLNAVWRSDEPPRKIRMLGFDPLGERVNSGGNTLAVLEDYSGPHSVEVDTVSLDALIEPFTKVRLLKVDCEGSEYPIIFTSKLLARCNEIVMEVHPISLRPEAIIEGRTNNYDGLSLCLKENGFKCEVVKMHETGWAYIFARR